MHLFERRTSSARLVRSERLCAIYCVMLQSLGTKLPHSGQAIEVNTKRL
jgi:hypothetical protein